MNVKVNESFMGQVAKLNGAPKIEINTKGQKRIKKIELLRNSRVVKTWIPQEKEGYVTMEYVDKEYKKEKNTLYYYVRVTQEDEHLAWSSPVFIEQA